MRWLLAIGLFVLALGTLRVVGCGGDGGPGRTAEEPYSGGYDHDDLLTFVQGDGSPALQFPRNQLILRVTESTTRQDLLALLEEVNGTLIGQVPSLRLYQVEVGTTTEEELRELRAKLAEWEETETVAYNFLLTQAGAFEFETCPVGPDNRKLYDEEHVDPMDALCDVYAALEIVSGLRGSIPMQTVTLGLLEKGLRYGSVEFEDTPIARLSDFDAEDESDPHGNAVAGLICADNDKRGVNGIASAFLWDRLRVVNAAPRHPGGRYTLMAYAVTLTVLTTVGTDIVANTWFAFLAPGQEERFGPRHEEAQDLVALIMQQLSQVIFVNAAPNGEFRLTARNAYPAGIRLPNTITVGATVSESAARLPGTSYGDRIDISAPGEGFYVQSGEPGVQVLVDYGEGSTSLATPQVASAVALLKSVGGHMSPAAVKRYLLEYVGGEGLTGPIEVSGEGGVMLNYARSLTDLLWDRYQDRSWAFMLDTNENGVVDPPASLAFQMCVDFNLEIEGVGQFYIAPDADCFGQQQTILLSGDGSYMAIHLLGHDDGNSRWAGLAFNSIGTTTFAVDTPYDISHDGATFLMQVSSFTDRDGDCLADFSQPGDLNLRGKSIEGTFELSNCRVLERTANGKAKYLLVDLALRSTVEVGIEKWPGEFELLNTPARGWVQSILVHPVPPTATFVEEIDSQCSTVEP